MVTRIKFESESLTIDVIKAVSEGLERTWDDDDTLVFKKDGKKIGKIKKLDSALSITGTELEELVAPIVTMINNASTISDADKKKLLFKEEDNRFFTSLNENKGLMLVISKLLTRANVKHLSFEEDFRNTGDTVKKDITLIVAPREISDEVGTTDMPLLELLTPIKARYSLNELGHFRNDKKVFSPLVDETVKDVKLRDIVIGKYYTDRNIVQLFFNPFSSVVFHAFKDDMPELIGDFLDALKNAQLTKKNTSSISERLFITAFTAKAKDKKAENEQMIKAKTREINDFEQRIRHNFEDIFEMAEENKFIDKNVEEKGITLFSELEKTKTLPFIKDVTFEGEKIEMVFIPTSISVNNFSRYDGAQRVGKRTMWLGEMKFVISPNSFKIYGDAPQADGYPHPHGNNSNSPCMGQGDGKKKIYELLHAGKFSELAKMLWFWIKTFRNDGAYIHQDNWYDDRLRHGYPVWDEKGVRIKINDSDRLASGEQVELDKYPEYDDNIKKYKNAEM